VSRQFDFLQVKSWFCFDPASSTARDVWGGFRKLFLFQTAPEIHIFSQPREHRVRAPFFGEISAGKNDLA
jgi:hypothetical protein